MADLRAFALGAVALAALSSAAAAADLLPPPPAYEPPPPISAPELGGWYIRGDVGVGVNNSASFSTDSAISPGYTNEYYNNSLSEAALFDVGVGYQVNNWFRTDVTGELRGGSTFTGLQVSNATAAAGVVPGQATQYADFYRGNVSSAIALWNVYADLGTWSGFTPWVGAGVGAAFNKFSGGTDNGSNSFSNGVDALGNPLTFTSSSGGVFGSRTNTNLAWALMAGIDMSITRQLKLELGYRYLNYGSFKSGSAQCLSGNGGANGNAFFCSGGSYKLASQNLSSNDFRLGLRYYFDSPAPLPPPEAPLVRKY